MGLFNKNKQTINFLTEYKTFIDEQNLTHLPLHSCYWFITFSSTSHPFSSRNGEIHKQFCNHFITGAKRLYSVEQEFIFCSKLPDIEISTHLPLHSYCLENLSKFYNGPYLINGDTGESFTYSDVHLTVRKIASGLNTIGVNQHDVIMLVLSNSPQFTLAFLGASCRGADITTTNPFY